MTEIEIRRARAQDRAEVLAFCEHTWSDGDYIHEVWDKWLADTDGQLLVAVDNGHPVGLVHIHMQNASDAWQEGMRVAPEHRQRGIARRLSQEASAEAMRRGATVVRLLTNETNAASARLIELLHFRRVGVFIPHRALPLTDPPRRSYGLEDPVLATLEDLGDIIDYLNISNIFPVTGGLYYNGFVAYRISDTLLREKIEAGAVYLLKRWQRLDGLAIAEPRSRADSREKHLFIGYLDGTTESISLIAYALRRRLSEAGLAYVRVNAPDLMMIRDALSGAEYTSDGEAYYTYERSLE